MPEGIGYSFSPTAQGETEEERRRRLLEQGGGSLSPVQDAIRILSLRLPRMNMAGSIAPLQLLAGLGGAGLGGNPASALQLQRLGGGMAPGGPAPGGFMPPPSGPSGKAPTPNVDFMPYQGRYVPPGTGSFRPDDEGLMSRGPRTKLA